MDNRPSPTLLRSAQISPQLPSIQSEQLSYSLAAANTPTIFVPTISRLTPPSRPPRPNRRPSTASSAEAKQQILPPAPPMGELTPSSYSLLPESAGLSKVSSSETKDSRSGPFQDHPIQEMNRRAHAAVAGLRAEASRLSGTEVLPSPFDPSPDEHTRLSPSASSARDTNMVEPDYDWATPPLAE
ncbi:hypothetical protein C8Q80DRAFT_627605 [Daedaleopsis nitida]|nr:hypothetical protein C8Q80DRAFT_627605 [Daedaleopsis nitida]